MSSWEEKEYKVLLLAAPTLGREETNNAQRILNRGLGILNSHEMEEGEGFADNVTAELEVETSISRVMNRIKTERDVAFVITAGFDKAPLRALAHECRRRNVEFCHTSPSSPDLQAGMEDDLDMLGSDEDLDIVPLTVATPDDVTRQRELPGHSMDQEILTGPLRGSSEVMEERIGNVVLMLNTGVTLSHHYSTREVH